MVSRGTFIAELLVPSFTHPHREGPQHIIEAFPAGKLSPPYSSVELVDETRRIIIDFLINCRCLVPSCFYCIIIIV